MNNAIEMSGVTKTFGSHVAVNELNLVVPQGTVYGVIGPNGSGKTTTMRMILRILFPNQGRIVVLGSEHGGVVNNRIGYLPEERGLYKKMRVRDVLAFYAHLKGLRKADREIRDWLERFSLTEWADKRVEALSKGMAQKVQLKFLTSRVKLADVGDESQPIFLHQVT